jgi:hypothetical protein
VVSSEGQRVSARQLRYLPWRQGPRPDLRLQATEGGDTMSYDKYDAMADAAADKWDEAVQPHLDGLVDPIMLAVEETEEDQPHPWTYHRHLLQIWLDSDDGELRSLLEDEHREEAEEIAREQDPGPCCNQFSCPCGNTNNYPG